MPKSYTAGFLAFNGQNVHHRPSCLLITRTDGYVVGLTDFDRQLTFAGVTYQPAGGFTPSDTDLNLGTTANQITIQSHFSAHITEMDLWKGAYSGAAIRVFRVNPLELPTDLNAIPYQYEPLVNGRVAKVSMTDQTYVIECRGIQSQLESTQGAVTSKSCRNQFGDAICGFNVPSDSITVGGIQSFYQFTVGTSKPDNYYAGGTLTWATGANAGKTNPIVYSSGTTIRVLEPVEALTVGDTASCTLACDKTFGTCVQRFGNGTNFQGEPALPGTDGLLKDGTVTNG